MANTKYTPQQVAQLLASDEPTFILRAKDDYALEAILIYRDVLARNKDYVGASKVVQVIETFVAWQIDNADKVQKPTI